MAQGMLPHVEFAGLRKAIAVAGGCYTLLMAGVAPEELRICLRQNLLTTATVPISNAVLGSGRALLWCSAALLGSPGISWYIPQAEIKQSQSLVEKQQFLHRADYACVRAV